MTPPGYRWWEWQTLSEGRWYRLWISYGWIGAFIPLGIAALIIWGLGG